MAEKFKKNKKYDQNEVIKLMNVYHMALDAEDHEIVQETLTRLYLFIEKYVYKTLWENYGTLMKNPTHRDDLKQDVWSRIFQELPNYDPHQYALTTFVMMWIRHVVSDYTSKNLSKSTVYFAQNMQKINGAQNYCKANGLDANSMDSLTRLSGLTPTTVKHTLDLMVKKDSVSYEVLVDAGTEYSVDLKGPEEAVMESAAEQELIELCEEILNKRELTLFRMLVHPADGKKHASYRDMTSKIPGSNIPQLKKEVSRLITKITSNKKFIRNYPYIEAQKRALDNNYIPVLDSDDGDETDQMFCHFLNTMDLPETDDPQIKKVALPDRA